MGRPGIRVSASILLAAGLISCLLGSCATLAEDETIGRESTTVQTGLSAEDEESGEVASKQDDMVGPAESGPVEEKWVLTKKWESDSSGMEYTEYGYGDQWLQTSEVVYQYDYVCDEEDGTLAPVQGEPIREWFREYDDAGNLISEEAHDYEQDWWKSRTIDNSYDREGRLIRREVFATNENASDALEVTEESEYYEDGTLKARHQVSYDFETTGELEWDFYEFYDEEGRAVEQQKYKSDGSLYYRTQNEYDEEGRQTAHITTTEDGSYGIEQSWTQAYDAEGRLSQKEIVNDDTVFNYEYIEGRDFTLRLAENESEPGNIKHSVLDESGQVIYRSDGSGHMPELIAYDQSGEQVAQVLFDSAMPAITYYSFSDEHGNEIARRDIDAKNGSDFARVCEWMNTATGEVRQAEDLLQFEMEHSSLESYVGLESFNADPARECLGVWGYLGGVVVFREDGTCAKSYSNAIEEGTWKIANGKVTAVFGENPTEYTLSVSEDNPEYASLGGGYAADTVVHMARDI